MARTTAHYNLTVPELDDAPDVEALAQNFEDMDDLIYEHETTAQEYVDEQATAMRTETTTRLTALETDTTNRLNTFAASVPGLVTDAIGADVQARVTDYLDEHGISQNVSDITGAVGGVSAGGVTYTPDASTHVVTLPVVKSINGTITPDANGNVVLDTGAGAVKSINGTITPDANGNVVLDTGAGAVKSINGTLTPDANGNVALTAANISGAVRSIQFQGTTYSPNDAGGIIVPAMQLAEVAVYSFSVTTSMATTYSSYYQYTVTIAGLLPGDAGSLALDESGISSYTILEQYREAMACIFNASITTNTLTFKSAAKIAVPLLLKVVRNV